MTPGSSEKLHSVGVIEKKGVYEQTMILTSQELYDLILAAHEEGCEAVQSLEFVSLFSSESLKEFCPPVVDSDSLSAEGPAGMFLSFMSRSASC